MSSLDDSESETERSRQERRGRHNVILKRYSDTRTRLTGTNLCRGAMFLLSIAAGIVLGIYLLRKLRDGGVVVPPPNDMIDDESQYLDYLTTDKALMVWSHTAESKVKGIPAYQALLMNDANSLSYLMHFLAAHKIGHIYLYAGCYEWEYEHWREGRFPQHESLIAAIQALDRMDVSVSLVAYHKDDPNDFLDHESIVSLAQAYVNLQRDLGSVAVPSILLDLEPTNELAFPYALDTLYRLRTTLAALLGEEARPRVLGVCTSEMIVRPMTYLPALYDQLPVVPWLQQRGASMGGDTMARLLGMVADEMFVLVDSANELTLYTSWQRAHMEGDTRIHPVLNADLCCFGRTIPEGGQDAFLREFSDHGRVCDAYTSEAGVSGCGPTVLSDYLHYHTALYTIPPDASHVDFLRDLYLLSNPLERQL
eukprot:gnl/Dysnectes_brevis/7019_a11384_186.p1 GENE.gnl/Dysnectes_brevis/7019_a11384_186~~gnl/Dysnectes_brevis/7019_a11384_186.p1  ORF type:complete len:424 (-),score=184.82 gnl/Dysnectes_brevis/7019_a11384_186:33-1304(-)